MQNWCPTGSRLDLLLARKNAKNWCTTASRRPNSTNIAGFNQSDTLFPENPLPSSKGRSNNYKTCMHALSMSWQNNMWPKTRWDGLCIADEFAHGQSCGIGGFVAFSTNPCVCILQTSLNLRSRCRMIFKKIFQVLKLLRRLPWCSLWSDTSQVVEWHSEFLLFPRIRQLNHKLFSAQMLLALFLERLSILISSSTVEVDVSHIAGKSSDVADALSQWDHKGDPPCNCLLADRFPLTSQALWAPSPSAQLCPAMSSRCMDPLVHSVDSFVTLECICWVSPLDIGGGLAYLSPFPISSDQ